MLIGQVGVQISLGSNERPPKEWGLPKGNGDPITGRIVINISTSQCSLPKDK